MSYILEAIKKADQKRKLGCVPDVHTDHGTAFSGDRRRRWPYWVALALFVNAGLLGWWLFPRNQQAPSFDLAAVQTTVAETAETEPVDHERVVAVEGAQTLGSVSGDDEDVSGVEDSELSKTPVRGQGVLPIEEASALPRLSASALATKTDKIGENPAPAEIASVVAEGAARVDGQAPMVSDVASADTSLAEPVLEESINGEPRGGELGEVTDEAGSSEPLDMSEGELRVVGSSSAEDGVITEGDLVEEYKNEKEKESDGKALERIPFYYQLPESVQKIIPEVHISFHMYAHRPSARIVSVNGKILREGQDLDKNVKLEWITPSGVVLVADTWRFKVDVE